MSLANSERPQLIRQFAEMALVLEATKEDIRREYRAWSAESTTGPQLYKGDETFSKAARIVDLEARVLAKVTDKHQLLAAQVLQLVQQRLGHLDAATRRYIFEGGPLRRQFIDRIVQYMMRQMGDEGLPDHPSGVPSWPHQKRAFQFAKDLPAVGLFMEMGSGKTKVAVDLITNRGHKRTLVVCPKPAMADVWLRQIPVYSHIPIDVVILDGSTADKKMEQAKAALARAEEANRPIILVVNYESVWRKPLGPFLKQAGLDCVVLDESHRIKSPGSRVSIYCAELGKRVPYRMALTGTPAHNSPLDVYAQYRFLDLGVFGTSFSAFRNRYAVMGGYGGYQVIAYRTSPTLPDGRSNPYYSLKLDREFQERMYSIAFRVRTGDVLSLPPEIDEERRFSLSNSARKIYTKLYRDMVADVGSGKVTITNALTRLLRLQQITSGFLPVESDKDNTINLQRIDTGKQELLADLLEDLPAHEPLVVFFRFIHDADVIRQVVKAAGRRCYELSGRVNQLEDWKTERSENLPASVIAVQTQAGGVGVDLTRACYCVYYSLGFSLGDYEQSRRRINRPGQTRPVRFYHLIANGTVDDKVYAALKAKADVVSHIVDSMKMKKLIQNDPDRNINSRLQVRQKGAGQC